MQVDNVAGTVSDVRVVATVSDTTLTAVNSVAATLNSTRGDASSWLTSTFSSLRSAGATNPTAAVLSAAATSVDTPPPVAEPEPTGCRKNMAACVAPPVVIVLVLAAVFILRRRNQSRTAVESLEESNMSQNSYMQWYAQPPGVVAAPALIDEPGLFSEPGVTAISPFTMPMQRVSGQAPSAAAAASINVDDIMAELDDDDAPPPDRYATL